MSTAAFQLDTTSAQMSQSPDPTKMSFAELDARIREGLTFADKKHAEIRPHLARMREILSRQGKRTDLPSDTPKGLTWQKWVENNKHVFGSLATVKRLLAVPKKKNSKLVVQTKVDTTIKGEYSPSDHRYYARAKVVEWSADGKIKFQTTFDSPAEDVKKKRLALAIEAFRNLRIRMKKFEVWHQELDVEMQKCLDEIED
jgi:hypothetical protein